MQSYLITIHNGSIGVVLQLLIYTQGHWVKITTNKTWLNFSF